MEIKQPKDTKYSFEEIIPKILHFKSEERTFSEDLINNKNLKNQFTRYLLLSPDLTDLQKKCLTTYVIVTLHNSSSKEKGIEERAELFLKCNKRCNDRIEDIYENTDSPQELLNFIKTLRTARLSAFMIGSNICRLNNQTQKEINSAYKKSIYQSRKISELIPYNYYLVSLQGSLTEEKKIQLLELGCNQDCNESLVLLAIQYIESPQLVLNTLTNSEILDFDKIQRVIKENKIISHILTSLDLRKNGIGCEAVDPKILLNELTSIIVSQNFLGLSSHAKTNIFKASSLIRYCGYVINDINASQDDINQAEETMGFCADLLIESIPELKDESIEFYLMGYYWKAMAQYYIGNPSDFKESAAYAIQLLKKACPNVYLPKLAFLIYLHSKLIIEDQIYNSKLILKELELSVKLGCMESQHLIDEIEQSISKKRNTNRVPKRKNKSKKEIEAIKRSQKREKEEQEKLYPSSRTSEKNIKPARRSSEVTTPQEDWVSCAIALQDNEKSLTAEVKSQALELEAKRTRKAELKAQKLKETIQKEEVKDEDPIETSILPYTIGLNKDNRTLLLHILSFHPDAESKEYKGNRGTSDIRRTELITMLKDLNCALQVARGKGGHSISRIPRIDMNTKSIKPDTDHLQDIKDKNNVTITITKDELVLKPYIKQLAEAFILLGYNENTVVEARSA